MYPLFIDKNEEFSCEIIIEGADTKTAVPRLLLETKHWNLIFEGTIKGDKCVIPLKKLKSILEEGDSGKIKLEVIADDTLLVPWENDFEAKVSKKASVSINEDRTVDSKPTITVNVKNSYPTSYEEAFVKILKENKIDIYNIEKKPKTFNRLLENFILNNVPKKEGKKILTNYSSFIDNILKKIK